MFYVALTLLVGSLLLSILAAMIKLPTVTGYIFGGLLLGPSFFHIMPENVVKSMDIISEIALAFISFTIGLCFKFSYLRRVGLFSTNNCCIRIYIGRCLSRFILVFNWC